MFKEFYNTVIADASIPMYGAIDPQVYFDNPDPTGFIEALSNDDLFNTQVLNRMIKNIYENENDNFSFMNAFLSQYGIKGDAILSESSFNNSTSTQYSIFIDETNFTTKKYFTVRPGILAAETNKNQKVFNIRPLIYLLERQIRKALNLYTIKEDGEEGIEIKFINEKFMAKITKFVDNEKKEIFFGCNEAYWNSNDNTLGYDTSTDLLIDINNYDGLQSRGDLYSAVSGQMELYRCQPMINVTTGFLSKFVYFDKNDYTFKADSTIFEIGVPIYYSNSQGVSRDCRFIVPLGTGTIGPKQIEAKLFERPVIDLTVLNGVIKESINNQPFTNSGFIVEDFQNNSNYRQGFTAANSSSYIKNNGSILDSVYPIISFNVFIPENSSGNIVEIPATNKTYINIVDESGGYFSLNASYASPVDASTKAFIICDDELASVDAKVKKFLFGYHHIFIIGTSGAYFNNSNPIYFRGINGGYKINEIKIYNGYKYYRSSIYQPVQFFYENHDLIRGLMTLDNTRLRTNSDEVLENVSVDTVISATTDYYGTVGEDVRKGLTVNKVGKDLVLSAGMFSKYDDTIQEYTFTDSSGVANTWNGYNPTINLDFNYACMAVDKTGKFIILCETNGYAYYSENYGGTYTRLDDFGQKDWTGCTIESNSGYITNVMVVAYNQTSYFMSNGTGYSWVPFTTSPPINDISFDTDSSKTIAVSNSSSLYYRNSTSTATWSSRDIGVSDNWISCKLVLHSGGSNWLCGIMCSASRVYAINRADPSYNFTDITSGLPSKTWKLVTMVQGAYFTTFFVAADDNSIYTKDTSWPASGGGWSQIIANNSFTSINSINASLHNSGSYYYLFAAYTGFIGVYNSNGSGWENISYENFENNSTAVWNMAAASPSTNYKTGSFDSIIGSYTDVDNTNKFIRFKKENKKLLYTSNLFKTLADDNTWKYITGNDVEEANEETIPSALPINNYFWNETLESSNGHYFNNTNNKRILAAVSKSPTVGGEYNLYIINCLENKKKVGNNENGYFIIHDDGKLENFITVEIITSETETPSSIGIGLTCYAGSSENTFPVNFIDKDIQVDISKEFGSIAVTNLTEEKIKLSIEASVPGEYVCTIRATGKWK